MEDSNKKQRTSDDENDETVSETPHFHVALENYYALNIENLACAYITDNEFSKIVKELLPNARFDDVEMDNNMIDKYCEKFKQHVSDLGHLVDANIERVNMLKEKAQDHLAPSYLRLNEHLWHRDYAVKDVLQYKLVDRNIYYNEQGYVVLEDKLAFIGIAKCVCHRKYVVALNDPASKETKMQTSYFGGIVGRVLSNTLTVSEYLSIVSYNSREYKATDEWKF
jgi:hypothetical protein